MLYYNLVTCVFHLIFFACMQQDLLDMQNEAMQLDLIDRETVACGILSYVAKYVDITLQQQAQ